MSDIEHIIWWDGQYKGKKLQEVDDKYLRNLATMTWVHDNDLPLYEAARRLCKERNIPLEKPTQQSTQQVIVSADQLDSFALAVKGIRAAMIREYHPDKHPNEPEAYHRAMTAVNDFADKLEKAIKDLRK